MIITHKVKNEDVSKNIFNTIERNASIFLLSSRGHYFSIPAVPSDQLTNFNGWMNILDSNDAGHAGYTLYKSIDNIYLNKTTTQVVNNFTNFERWSAETVERFTLAKNGLIYEVDSYSEYIHLDLDFRGIFDTNDQGRIYKIYRHDDILIVEYSKYSDNSLQKLDGRYFLAIRGVGEYEALGTWSQKFYHYDLARRNTAGFYVYNALKIPCRKNIKLFFAFAADKDLAMQKVDDISMNESKIDNVHTHYMDNVLSVKNSIREITGQETAFAYTGCVHALDGLAMQLSIDYKRVTGMWAGLPWFFQYWSRDELISVYSLLLEHRYEYGKEVLMKYLAEILADGRLSNRYPSANLGNADSIGWLFKRIKDFLFLCERRNNFNSYFSLFDLTYVRDRLKFSIKMLLKEHSKDGLIYNDKLETWMDTYNPESFERDNRDGARIEIQALFLSMLQLLNMLENYMTNRYVKKNDKMVRVVKTEMNSERMENDMREKVRERFLKNINGVMTLSDGYEGSLSEVVRPNIFLAYYIYPNLLSKDEWTQVFDNALPKLWCDWDMGEGVKGGGLSTIDKTHPLYQPYYTGIDNKSYHRGDSWFWINNIAAIAMYRLDKERYKDQITKIMASSAQDILYWGFVGYASELASSGWFKSGGCLCQTWSLATYIELVHEVYIE